jgi:hypothetical protein
MDEIKEIKMDATDWFDKEFPKFKRGLTPSICIYLMAEYSQHKTKTLSKQNYELKRENERLENDLTICSSNADIYYEAGQKLGETIADIKKENTQLKERVRELEKKSQYWCDRYNETTRF